MIRLRFTNFGLVLAITSLARALSVIQGSPCFDTCAGNTATTGSDIVCTDQDFTDTGSGKTLTECMNCLHESDHRSGFMTDSILFLYYLDIVQQTCLGDSANTGSCSSQCSSLSEVFPTGGSRNSFQSPYSYCSANNNAYSNSAANCAACLQSNTGKVILGNLVEVGFIACETTPSVQDGTQVQFSGDPFNTIPLGSSSSSPTSSNQAISASATTQSSSPSSPFSTTSIPTSKDPASITVVLTATVALTPSSTAQSANRSSNDTLNASATLSRGAAAGIGIALGLVGIAAILILAILLRRRLLRKGSNFTRMSSPAMAKRSATPPAAGVFVPPGYKSSHLAATAATVGAFGRIGIGQSIAKEKPEKNVEAVGVEPKHSKSFKSITSKSWKSRNITPRTSTWFYAANPKQSSDLTALPQPWVIPGMDGIPEMPSSRGTQGRGWD